MNFPTPVTKAFLGDVIKDVAEKVAAGDSFEGFIEYTVPTGEIVPDGTYALLRARYRIGNLDGQGGMRMFGRMHQPPWKEVEKWSVQPCSVPDKDGNYVEGFWAADYTTPDEDLGVKGPPSDTLITLTYFKQSLEQQRDRLEDRAVKLEDDWGSLEHHQVAKAYGEKNAFDDVLEKLNDLIKGEEMKR